MILKKNRSTAVIGTILLCFISLTESIAQSVGIGTETPDKSAVLEVLSTSKGLLLPRMTLNQRNSIQQPAVGLIVYQTDLLDGLYVFNGSGWGLITSGAAANLTANSTTWNTSGNEVLGTENFIGTLDDAPLVFKVNNQFSGLLDSKRSNTFLGYKTGWATKSFNSVVIGAFALQRASTGNDNVVVGFQSMFSHENGQYNVALGSLSLSSSIIGDKNTALGAMAGYRAKGNSNVFVGFQAGYFEQGNDKLYINNNASQTPLIYGDFGKQMVGINTSKPANKLSIKGSQDGESGLQLQSLTSASRAVNSNGKALSVDEVGNVILVLNTADNNAGTGTGSSFWQERGNGIKNLNEGDVLINKNIIVNETIIGNRLEVADGGIVFKKLNATTIPLDPNGKSLSLDNFGNVILVKNESAKAETTWQTVGSDLMNNNSGKVVIKKDLAVTNNLSTTNLTIKEGKFKFGNLSSNSLPSASNGKVLTLDTDGNIILANDGIGNTDPGQWKKTGNGIKNLNEGDVLINKNIIVNETIIGNRLEVADGGIVFKKLNATTIPLDPNGKSLSLDNFGNVILVKNDSAKAEITWQTMGSDLMNNNSGKVVIKKNLEVTDSLLTANLTIKEGKFKFDNLSSNSLPSASNGKVLTLDTDGNIILANDGIGNTDPEQWKKTGNRVELQQSGQVVIGDGITEFPAAYNLFVSKGILAEHVRVAVPNSEKWADYVFEPDYRLMPLQEVEKFIITYGHLPKIYSATDAAEQGMDVLEMNVKLLEKVEELTLYAIDANKRIELLEQRLEKLEK
jgi:hypothetical protein